MLQNLSQLSTYTNYNGKQLALKTSREDRKLELLIWPRGSQPVPGLQNCSKTFQSSHLCEPSSGWWGRKENNVSDYYISLCSPGREDLGVPKVLLSTFLIGLPFSVFHAVLFLSNDPSSLDGCFPPSPLKISSPWGTLIIFSN